MAVLFIFILAGLSVSFPADVAFLFAMDLSTWAEAAVAVYVAAQVTRIRPFLALVRARLFIRNRPARQRRTSATQHREKPSNDDDPAPFLALTA